MTLIRTGQRQHDQLRPISVTYNVMEYASGSVLLELGKTRVICTATVQSGVPPHLKGSKTGWLTAEYAMLPSATHERTPRESTTGKRNGRNMEISRLIGRCLRSVINLANIGEQTIYIDCDVLQADGGTRTACITAASLALMSAQQKWLTSGIIKHPIMNDELAAVSVGITDGTVLLDLDYEEDSEIDADFNVILTKSGTIVEIQGCAERKPMTWDQFESIKSLAIKGVKDMFAECRKFSST